MSRRLRSRSAAIEAKRAFAWSTPVVHDCGPEDDADDEGGIDARDSFGPAGTYGCACVSRDPRSCLVARSDSLPSLGEQCECMCHGWSDHDD